MIPSENARIRTVIYDLDDTLYDFRTINRIAQDRLCREAGRRLGIPAEEFEQVFTRSYHGLEEWLPEDIRGLASEGVHLAIIHSRALRMNYTLEALGQPLLPHAVDLYDCYWEYVLEQIRPEPELIETLGWLKAQGIRIGVGSNMTARIQYRKLINLGLSEYIDFVVTSDETVFDKPDERFFRKVVEKAGCPAEECLFVGDNYRLDYLGSQNCGLQSLWYHPERLEKEQNEHPDAQMIRIHAEIRPIIERANT